MANPVPSTTYQQARAKVSDGKSVKVTVPENTTVEAGTLVLLDGFLGFAVQGITTAAGETAEIVLNIEQAEYETDQINAAETFAKGADIYWDAANKRLTEVAAGNRYAGTVTEAKDANNVIWFKLAPQSAVLTQAAAQADSVAADVAGVVADLNALLAKLRTAGLMAQ